MRGAEPVLKIQEKDEEQKTNQELQDTFFEMIRRQVEEREEAERKEAEAAGLPLKEYKLVHKQVRQYEEEKAGTQKAHESVLQKYVTQEQPVLNDKHFQQKIERYGEKGLEAYRIIKEAAENKSKLFQTRYVEALSLLDTPPEVWSSFSVEERGKHEQQVLATLRDIVYVLDKKITDREFRKKFFIDEKVTGIQEEIRLYERSKVRKTLFDRAWEMLKAARK